MLLITSQIAFLIIVFISVSLWEYVTFQRNTTPYPYREGFAIFSLLQWLGVFLGMIGIFGFSWGIGIAVFCMVSLQYICHFTLGPLWNKLAQNNYLLPTAVFAITVWVVVAFGIYHFV
ncbi:MAG: hypothetical protein ABL911_05925 [Gallionella sp.]|nr:hypothetical protein [Gallionella sp.]